MRPILVRPPAALLRRHVGARRPVVRTVWGTAMIGAIVGLVGSIIWLATRMGRNAA
jgi:hypothetical protein